MGHIVHIYSDEQFIRAMRVLDKLGTTWQGVGPSSAPRLLLTETQYNALVEAGVIPANDKEVKGRGKKASAKKTKS
jgi:adenylosuccinate synthase